jgi:cytochrome c5
VSIRFLTISLVFTVTALFAAEPKPGSRSGEEIYKTYCGSCHGGGWQAAPVAYDERDWSERVAKGFQTMFENAKMGLNTMPPMGTCMDCTDAELTAAINEMLRF